MSFTETEKNFFGREDVLDLLKKRVLGLKEGYRQNVALLGRCYLGKSTALKKFLFNLDENDVTSIYLDLEKRDFKYFVSKFIGSLLYDYSKSQNLPLHEDVDVLIESTKDSIPNTIAVIKRIQEDLKKGKISNSYLGILTLPEVFTNETGRFCVLILDEFQDMERYGISHVFQILGKKIMTHKRCFYIVASSYPAIAQKILSEKLSLLFGNFETIDIAPFKLDESQKFVEYVLGDKKIGSHLSNFLTDFTAGHPLYLNLISQELINLSAVHNQKEIYLPILSKAVENTIFNRWGIISRHFELIINELCLIKGNQGYCSLFIALSNGKNKVDELVVHLGIKKLKLVSQLNKLIETEILVKNGNVYYFKDKLFKYWIKYVYQKRLKSVELSFDHERKNFKDEFHRMVDHFMSSSRQKLSSRILELIGCFENELFNLNGRRYRLPMFSDIETTRITNEKGMGVDVIRAKAKNTSWVIAMKKDSVGESDVNAILSETKRTGKKSTKCLLISLSDLDENIRLRALQERFWIWNEEEINTLLTLFDKPFIVK